MTNQHPITPPPELVSDWRLAPEFCDGKTKLTMITITVDRLQYIATQAANWGADIELEACCEWLEQLRPQGDVLVTRLRTVRRPEPPSLKEQALKAMDDICFASFEQNAANIIRRALEQLDD